MMNLDEMYAAALVNRRTKEPVNVMRDGSEMLYLAQADDFTAMATEMAGGTEPPGATPMTLRQFGETVADTPASLLKGRIQGQAGLIGDTIAFGRGIGAAINPNPGESRLDAFLRAIGDPVKVFGYDITTEGISKILDETLGPVVPAGSRPGRAEVAKTGETVGEIFGLSKAASEAVKAARSGARAISREIATTPPTGAVQVAPTPVQAPRSEIGFYSAVEETVANIPQAKGTGQQYLAQIQKSAGVKPEELKWTGLDEFLKGKKSVTKQEIQDYLNANRVDVKEVRLGEMSAEQSLAINQAENRYREITDLMADTRQKVEEGLLSIEEARTILNPLYRERGRLDNQILFNAAPATTFSQYTLPGGQNYREILLTLPAKDKVTREASNAPAGWGSTDGGTSGFVERGNTRADFRSGHFNQPNVLAHMRVNDRVVDGKKTLFIEEIQSDWHQAGRKKGYGPQTETTVEAYYTADSGRRISLGFGKTQEEAAAAVDPGWKGLVDVKFDTQTKKVAEGVPDAPFKTSWHELTLKRAIQEASEKGYDQIAFTTGKTQAERYDLNKQVDSIVYAKENDGTYSLVAIKNGRELIKRDSVAESALPNLVGKEVAERMAASEGKSIPGGPERELSGENLRVGGEGMKGFYDQILPKSLEKLGKKFDAKVGKTEMDGVEIWAMDITPKMRESVVSKGQPLFVAPVVAPGMMQEKEAQ